MEELNPKCAFPGCKNRRKYRRKNQSNKVKFFKWCRFHRSGKGKEDRLKYTSKLRVFRKDNYKLEVHILPGTFGEPSLFFELVRLEMEGKNKGMLIRIPFVEPFKVRVSELGDMFELPYWSDEELQKLLEDKIKEIGNV